MNGGGTVPAISEGYQCLARKCCTDGVHRQFRATPGLESLDTSTQTRRTRVVGAASFIHNGWTNLPTGKPFEFPCDGRSRAMQRTGDVPRRALLAGLVT